MRHLAVFALFLSAALSICAPHTARASTAMWGAVPKNPSTGFFTFFSNAQDACVFEHEHYSPMTPLYGVVPNYDGLWRTSLCDWPPLIGWSDAGVIDLYCVNADGTLDSSATIVPPGFCISQGEPGTSRPKCTYNMGGTPNPPVGDPILLSTGSLDEEVTDYVNSDNRLRISRTYRSRAGAPNPYYAAYAAPYGAGDLWRFNFQWEISLSPTYFSDAGLFTVTAPDGSRYDFTLKSDGTVSANDPKIHDITVQYVNPAGGSVSYSGILASGAEFTIATSDGTQVLMQLYVPYWATAPSETGDYEAGHPTQIAYRGGYSWSFTYGTQGELQTIADNLGRSISVSWYYSYLYDETTSLPRAIEAISMPDGTALTYTYESYTGTQGGTDGYARLKTFMRTQNGAIADSATYIYNDPNSPLLLSGAVDNSGVQYQTWQYDSEGRVTSATHPDGADAVSISYAVNTSNYQLTRTVTNPLGRQTVYTFQGSYTDTIDPLLLSVVGNPTSTCIGTIVSFQYDSNYRKISTVDANGNTTKYTYGPDNRVATKTEAYDTTIQRVTQYTWNDSFGVPTQTIEPGLTTNFTYDSVGHLTQRQQVDTTTQTSPYSTNGETRTWTYGYNSAGLLASIQVPSGSNADTTLLGYDSVGYLTSTTNALGQSLQITSLDGAGRPLTETDQNGVSTALTYDAAGRLLSRSVAGETTSYAYGPTGLLNRITLADGSFIQYSYDDARRLTQVSDSLGDVETYTLDAMGDRTADNVYDPSGTLVRTHSRVFDSLGRIYEEINAAGTPAVTTDFSYDGNGNLTVTAAPLYRNAINAYDALNRLNQVTDPAGGVTQFDYNSLDQLTSVSDPRGLITSYTYSGLGNLIQLSSPDTGTSTTTYDAGGRPTALNDARGAASSYGYDALNRVTSIAYSLGGTTDQTITFTYDQGTYGIGHLTSAADANQSMGFTYDALGEITGVSQTAGGVNRSVSYAYTNGDLTTLTTPSGQSVSYGYNTNHEITSIAVNGTTLLSNVNYEPFGPVEGWTWGNGASFARSFNTDGLITGINSSGSQESLSYDDASRISGITNSAPGAYSWTYGYDQLDRLTSAIASSVTQGWTYDADGNRTTETGTFASTYSISAASNQITGITGALNRTYSYDASGNTLTDTDITATYNGAGRLKSETSPSGSTSFVYNALGQMIEASGAAGAIVYAYDQAGHLIGEYDGAGNLIQETIWLGDIPVATIQPSGSSVAIYYVETDQLNTPREVIRPSDNALMWTWFSGPFGVELPNTNPQGAGTFTYDLRLPGQIAGTWGSTFQNDHRDYDPFVGRYVEPDPIGQHFYFSLSIFPGVSVLHRGYWNRLYIYGDDEPMSMEDPTGLGLFGWVLDLFQERAPESTAEATTKSVAVALAALCATEHCGQQRDSTELYGDCAEILGRWIKQQGPELVGFLDGLSDTSENGLLTDCAEGCARGIKTGHCCKGGKQ